MDPLDCTLDELCNKNERKRKRYHRHSNQNYSNYNNQNHYTTQPSSLKRFKKHANYNNHNHYNKYNNCNYNHYDRNNNHHDYNRNVRSRNRNYNSNHYQSYSKPIEPTLPSAPSSNYYIRSDEEEKEKGIKYYGFVTLIMRGDDYVPGALILAHSLRLVDTLHSLIVMVTNDVTERARQALHLLYDHVIEVPYVKYSGQCQRMKTDKQQEKYRQWASDSFTKWNILQLNHLLESNFDKLLFLDSDKIVLQNIDHLFTDTQITCPAGTFSSPWTSHSNVNGNGLIDYYPHTLAHGDQIPAQSIYNALYKNGFVAVGTCMLFKPNSNEFNKFIQMLDSKWISDEYLENNIDKEQNNTSDLTSKRMIGFKNCYSMLDEQSIVFFYFYHKRAWSHIHTKYNFIPWHFKWLQNDQGKLDIPLVLHFFGMKPWKLSPLEWRDLQAWWALVYNLVHASSTDTYKWNQKEQSLIASFFDLGLMKELPFDLSEDSAERRKVTCFWCYELAKRQGLRPIERIKSNDCDAMDWIFHCPIDPLTGKLCCPNLKV